MDRKQFIEKWKWQKVIGGGSASFDFGEQLEKDLNVQNRHLIKHHKRLLKENRELKTALWQERKYRSDLKKWYEAKLRRKVMSWFDAIFFMYEDRNG